MNFNVKATQIDLTPELSDYLDKRLAALKKLIGEDAEVVAYVELAKTTNHHKSGDLFQAEMNFKAFGKSFFAKGEGDDIRSAIDVMRDEILEEVRSWKDKQESLVKRGGAKEKEIVRDVLVKEDEAAPKDWIEEEAEKEIGKI